MEAPVFQMLFIYRLSCRARPLCWPSRETLRLVCLAKIRECSCIQASFWLGWDSNYVPSRAPTLHQRTPQTSPLLSSPTPSPSDRAQPLRESPTPSAPESTSTPPASPLAIQTDPDFHAQTAPASATSGKCASRLLIRLTRRMQRIRQQHQSRRELRFFRGEHRRLPAAVRVSAQKHTPLQRPAHKFRRSPNSLPVFGRHRRKWRSMRTRLPKWQIDA